MDDARLNALTQRLIAAAPATAQTPTPDRESAALLCQRLLTLLFPGAFAPDSAGAGGRAAWTAGQVTRLEVALTSQLARLPGQNSVTARELALEVLDELPEIRGLVETDVDAAYHNDPSAPDRSTIILSFPCLEALAVQRFAHRLYRRGVPTLPRMMTEVAHAHTGIDIHPGTKIGESFFIDHGTGVVIGETSTIGNHCVLYQGVGLVAWNPLAKDDQGELRRGQSNKRHPDLEDHVTIYAGAMILGGDTVIGHHSVIGGNVWLTKSVEPHSVVTIKDPELQIRKRRI